MPDQNQNQAQHGQQEPAASVPEDGQDLPGRLERVAEMIKEHDRLLLQLREEVDTQRNARSDSEATITEHLQDPSLHLPGEEDLEPERHPWPHIHIRPQNGGNTRALAKIASLTTQSISSATPEKLHLALKAAETNVNVLDALEASYEIKVVQSGWYRVTFAANFTRYGPVYDPDLLYNHHVVVDPRVNDGYTPNLSKWTSGVGAMIGAGGVTQDIHLTADEKLSLYCTQVSDTTLQVKAEMSMQLLQLD